MKKLLFLSFFLMNFLNASSVSVVVVNIQEVTKKSEWFSKLQKAAQESIQRMVKEMQELEKKYMALREKMEKGSTDMKEAARQSLQAELQALESEMQMKQRNLQMFAEAEGRKVEEKLLKAIQQICARLGYDIVVPMALYAKASCDKTEAVIKELDAMNPTSASAHMPTVATKKSTVAKAA